MLSLADSSSASPVSDRTLLGFINALYGSILNCCPGGTYGSCTRTNALPKRSIEEQIYNLHVEILARDTIFDRFGKRFTFRSREEHRHRRRLKKYCDYLKTHMNLIDNVLKGTLPVVQENRDLFNALLSGFSRPNSASLTPDHPLAHGHYGCCYNCYAKRFQTSLKNPLLPAPVALEHGSCLQSVFIRIWAHMHKLRLTICITKEIKRSLENKLQQALGLLVYHEQVQSPTADSASASKISSNHTSTESSSKSVASEALNLQKASSPIPMNSLLADKDENSRVTFIPSLDPTATTRSPGLDFDRRASTSFLIPDDSLDYDHYTFVPSIEKSKISVLEFCEIPAMVLRANLNILNFSKKLRVAQKYDHDVNTDTTTTAAATTSARAGDGDVHTAIIGPNSSTSQWRQHRSGSLVMDPPLLDRAAKVGAIGNASSLLFSVFPRYTEFCSRKLHSFVDEAPMSCCGDVNDNSSVLSLSLSDRWGQFVADFLRWKDCKYALEKQFSSLLMELFRQNSSDGVAVSSEFAGAEKSLAIIPSLATLERLLANWQTAVRLGSPVSIGSNGVTAADSCAVPIYGTKTSDSKSLSVNAEGVHVACEGRTAVDESGNGVDDDLELSVDLDLDLGPVLILPPDKSLLYSTPRSVLVFAKYAGRFLYDAIRLSTAQDDDVDVTAAKSGIRIESDEESELKRSCETMMKSLLLRNICKNVLQYPAYNTVLQQRDSKLLKQHSRVHYLCTPRRDIPGSASSCSSSHSTHRSFSVGSSGSFTHKHQGGGIITAVCDQYGDELSVVQQQQPLPNVVEADKHTLALLSTVGVPQKWITQVNRQCRCYCARKLNTPSSRSRSQSPSPSASYSLAYRRLTVFAPLVTENDAVSLYDFLVSVVFVRSIRMISLLQSAIMPQELLSIAICAMKWMMVDASSVCTDYQLQGEGLDETLPFIILLVLLSTTNCVHNLNLLLHLMREYECPIGQLNCSEEQYYLTCFEAAIAFIIQRLDVGMLSAGGIERSSNLTSDLGICIDWRLQPNAVLQYEDEKALSYLREWLQEQLAQDDVNALIRNLHLQGYL